MSESNGTVDKTKQNLRLRIVYDTRTEPNGIYVEYLPEDFKRILIEEFNKYNDISIAFDKVCKKLKAEILKM
jgi:hypothetical protein